MLDFKHALFSCQVDTVGIYFLIFAGDASNNMLQIHFQM